MDQVPTDKTDGPSSTRRGNAYGAVPGGSQQLQKRRPRPEEDFVRRCVERLRELPFVDEAVLFPKTGEGAPGRAAEPAVM